MSIIFNIIVLIFEILYYSLFMKYVRDEGKFYKYLILFTLISAIFYFISTKLIYSYLVLILFILYGLKFLVKIKVGLYDMLIILIMLFLKAFIEFPFVIILYQILKINQFIVTIIFGFAKILFLVINKNIIKECYKKMKRLWDNNNFYIRYIFSCATFIYVIITIILLIKMA